MRLQCSKNLADANQAITASSQTQSQNSMTIKSDAIAINENRDRFITSKQVFHVGRKCIDNLTTLCLTGGEQAPQGVLANPPFEAGDPRACTGTNRRAEQGAGCNEAGWPHCGCDLPHCCDLTLAFRPPMLFARSSGDSGEEALRSSWPLS